MPELPEVEMIKRVIEPQIVGQKIQKVLVNHPQVIATSLPHVFCQSLIHEQIKSMSRRGKFLMIHTNRYHITLHLRMTGRLLVTPADYEMEKHTHIIFQFESGKELRFIDSRRFGRFWLLEKNETDKITGIHKLGPEPFDPILTAEYLQTIFARRQKTIKECLLDQRLIAGIGNIYADEILFRIKIHPRRKASSLSFPELERLAFEIPNALHYYIDKNEISETDYLHGKGKDYRNTPYLNVYGHGGDPCPICSQTLKKIVIGGRSSVYCPNCQGEI